MAIQRALASASLALDALSYTLIDGMTLTPGKAPGGGGYLAFFSMDQTFADPVSGTAQLDTQIFENGVGLGHSIRRLAGENSIDAAQIPTLGSAFVDPEDGETIEVRYLVNQAGEFEGFNRELTLFPAKDILQDTATGDDTIDSSTFALLGSMSRTPPAGTYLLLFTTSADGPGDVPIGFRVSIAGTPVAHTLRQKEDEGSAPDTAYSIMIAALITVNGSQLVEIEWNRVGAGTVTCHERNLIFVPTKPSNIFQATGTANDTATSLGDVQIDDMSILDPGPFDYLALFSAYDSYQSTPADAKTRYSIFVDGVSPPSLDRTHEHEDSIDDAFMSVYSGGRITVPKQFPLVPIVDDDFGSGISAPATTHDITGATHGLTVGSGNDRYLLVAVGQGDTTEDVDSVIWDQGGSNQAMTRIGALSFLNDTRLELFELINPAAGNLALRVVLAGSAGIAVGLFAFEEVNQITPQRNLNIESADVLTPVTNTIPSRVGDVVIDAVSTRFTASGHTPGAGQTERFDLAGNDPGGIDDGLMGSQEAGAASVVMSWSVSVDFEWVSIGTSLIPAIGQTIDKDVNVFWRSSIADDRVIHERTFVLLREPFSSLRPSWPRRFPQLRM